MSPAPNNQDVAPATSHPKLPITLLSGFWGAGKTTLLRHVLQTQHDQKAKFRCAVIVNDMAELNIDKTLIEESGALVQSDDQVISMKKLMRLL
ncbi:CobW_C [Seminavis robusta]|uniref:CobW_C n=1 Tax=Seminavis robusta TaxID=568900 RepID=A0A9N8HCC4_9STRA|nr:CobW_C [Seminavis robusta]|eukprot:Sro313_g114830.1 CobW_C (93) ;mRNA; f:41775-42137